MTNIEGFLGKWQMLPELSNYAAGEPPKAATYEIVKNDDELTFIMEWLDAADKVNSMSYSEVCDGEFHAYNDTPIADEICLTLKSDTILESVAKLDGEVKLTAVRELSPDGLLKVGMTAKMPDGTPFDNYSVYKKI